MYTERDMVGDTRAHRSIATSKGLSVLRTFPRTPARSKYVTLLFASVGVALACSSASAAGPVATFDGYGTVRIGMAEEQATEAIGAGPREQSGGCIILGPGEITPVRAWISEKTTHLNGISTPPGTMTDLGVGDGSTVDEVRAAYAQFAIDDGPVTDGAGPRLTVYDGPKEFIAHRMLGFAVHPDGTVGPPSIGRPADWVGC